MFALNRGYKAEWPAEILYLRVVENNRMCRYGSA